MRARQAANVWVAFLYLPFSNTECGGEVPVSTRRAKALEDDPLEEV